MSFFLTNYIGIETSGYQPNIDNCTFLGGENSFSLTSAYGISLEYLIGNMHTSRIGDINGCSFYNMSVGILCRESSSRICTSNFEANEQGIGNVSSSFMNLGSNARNYFDSNFASIALTSNGDDIQLRWGHNQFYNGPGGYDFGYYTQRQNSEEPSGIYTFINADGNYWGDNEINTHTTSGNHPVIANYMDTAPLNYVLPAYYPDRYDNAGVLEDSCSYENASYAFRDILSDRLDEEYSQWGSCVDRSFKNAVWGEMDLYDLISYYDAQITQTPDSLSDLKLLVRDYQAKTFIELEDYQSAADLIELVLEDPESEVDSLNAVLDLEICYLLASLGQSKKPVTTNFAQYRYPDHKTYKVNHRAHMQQLMALLNKNVEEVPIPQAVTLRQNYPNPFNPNTTIEFSLPKQQKVKLTIYNIRGQVVKTLANGVCEKGIHKVLWEGKNSFGKPVATGVYFYRLEAGGKCFTHKMLMLK